jgi:hypothetical protein
MCLVGKPLLGRDKFRRPRGRGDPFMLVVKSMDSAAITRAMRLSYPWMRRKKKIDPRIREDDENVQSCVFDSVIVRACLSP